MKFRNDDPLAMKVGRGLGLGLRLRLGMEMGKSR
jgi:hypothetical protein